jgi:hypothetical protein
MLKPTSYLIAVSDSLSLGLRLLHVEKPTECFYRSAY